MRKAYKIKAVSKKSKFKLFKNLMQAAVNPEYLKKVSEILKRELIAEKDTEDYNDKVVSAYLDRPSIILREVGQKKLKSGDAYKINEKILSKIQDREDINFFYENKRAVGTYEFFPFTWELGQELRTHFILKTEKTDNFESLLDEVDGLIFNFLTIDDWTLIKNAIKKSEERLKKGKIHFLEPEVRVGNVTNLTNQEISTYSLDGLSKAAIVDVRDDNHDLLSLKEFISMLKGEKVHPLSIGPGFLAKYMPELLSLGVSAIVFKVSKNKLVEMKVNKFENASELMKFAPIDAAQALIEQYCAVQKKSFFFKDKITEYEKGSLFNNESKYYVVVDGCVSGPEKGSPMGYETLSINKVKVDAGEVFLFEEAEEQVQTTRLYFMPYNYQDLHMLHQHGSVIFGNNDQSFNSCVRDEKYFFDQESIVELAKRYSDEDKTMYDPAFLAAKLHFLPKGSTPDDLFAEENKGLLLKAMGSIFEETSFTIDYLVNEFPSMRNSGNLLIIEFLKHYAPLSKRFILGKYFEDDNGLMLERMLSTYAILSRDMFADDQIDIALNYIKKNPPKE